MTAPARVRVRRVHDDPARGHDPQGPHEVGHPGHALLEEVAEAAGRGDGDDDHHAGADSLQERHAENDHECDSHSARLYWA